MELNNITNAIQAEIVSVLENDLRPTSNGTEVMKITTEGTDDYDEYPVIRVVPSTVGRDVDSEARRYTYTPAYTISIYLDMADATYPTSEIIATLMELVDNVYDVLDGHDYQSLPSGATLIQQSSILSDINTLQTKTGTAVYCDIQYPVGISMGL